MGWFVLLVITVIAIGGGFIATMLGYRLQGIGVVAVAVVLFMGITALMSFATVENATSGSSNSSGRSSERPARAS